jgi:hypothetical protein
LDGEDIIYYFQAESFTYLVVQPTKLMVSKDDLERVKELIMELDLHYRFFS